MIGFRSERERTRERRLSLARAAIFFLWVILVFALISLFLSIQNESITSNNTRRSTRSSSSSHSIRPPPSSPWPRPLSRALFHAPPSTNTLTQARLVSTNGDPEHTVYEDDKRIVHTGPNPLHN